MTEEQASLPEGWADSPSAPVPKPRSGELAAEVEALARLNEASSRLWHLSNLEEGLQEILRSAIALLGSDKGTVQLLGADGSLRLAAQHGFDDELVGPLHEVQATPIVGRDGEQLGLISTHSRAPLHPSEQRLRLLDLYVQKAADYIDRCRREEHLRQSEQRLQALSDIAPATMLWSSAASGECTFISRGWYEFTGKTADGSLGMAWVDVIHADDRDRVRLVTDAATASREPFVVDHRMRRGDGVYRWVQSAGRPRLGPNGEFLGFVGSVVDVHELKMAENALRDSNRRKDEFLAVLSHELRNPLAPLATATDLLEHAAAKPEMIEKVRSMMRRQVDHLARLVDDLLDMSRISRGHAELQREPFDLRSAVESAIEQSGPLIAARAHRLSLELGHDPLCVYGDFQRLTQVFVNLLGNAAKYREKRAEIAVHVARDGDAALVRVTDHGFGIPRDRLCEVFEMFSQVPEHRSLVGGGGLGIGLALCRQLVELHGGSIEAKSEGLGRGSEFNVRLPLATLATLASKAADAAASKAGAEAPRRDVLVVDDNTDAAAALQMVLELQGHDARAVFNGAAALAALAERIADVVLLDLGLPGMDGYEVARRIRLLPTGRDVLLVAVTGWGQDQDRARTAEAGFDEHLTKPLDSARLKQLLAFNGRSGPKRVGPAAVGASKSAKPKIRRQMH